MTPFELLTHLKTTLAAIPGVASCKIGLETAITPADYPLIRLVPTRLAPPTSINGRRQIDVLIYLGVPVLEATTGLETIYAQLLALEGQVLEALQFTAIQTSIAKMWVIETSFVETVTDEDRLPHYKLFAMRWRVEG